VFSDQHRRRCFRCGHTGHVGQFCRAAIKASGATEALWSKMVLPAGAPAPPPVVLAVPLPVPPPAAAPAAGAAASLPGITASASGRAPAPPTGGGTPLPCAQRSRSASMSSVASEAADQFLSPASSLLGLASEDPLPSLPVAVKSKPVPDPPGQPAVRGRSQKARVGRAGRPSQEAVSPAAPDGRKRTAEPLHDGAAKVRGLITPPSQHISVSSPTPPSQHISDPSQDDGSQ
jgi:hypothetical protein